MALPTSGNMVSMRPHGRCTKVAQQKRVKTMKNKIVYLSKARLTQPVTFRSNIGISEETLDMLNEKGKQYGLEILSEK